MDLFLVGYFFAHICKRAVSYTSVFSLFLLARSHGDAERGGRDWIDEFILFPTWILLS